MIICIVDVQSVYTGMVPWSTDVGQEFYYKIYGKMHVCRPIYYTIYPELCHQWRVCMAIIAVILAVLKKNIYISITGLTLIRVKEFVDISVNSQPIFMKCLHTLLFII